MSSERKQRGWTGSGLRLLSLDQRAVGLILTATLLLPFVAKAITIDGPLFVWVAEQIHQEPLDPYGFDANWYVDPKPMHVNVQNPPLTSYWLALAGLVSWEDWWLHLSMVFWPLLAIAGTMRLARLFGAEPLLAGALTLGTPAFLVSATSVMADLMLLALMVLAATFWIEGLERGSVGRLIVGSLLIGAAALTKYFGIAMVPLLLVYTLAREKRPDVRLLLLGLPVAILLAWNAYSQHLYGSGHALSAIGYARVFGGEGGIFNLPRLYAVVTFLGGCLVWPLLVALWPKRWAARIFISSGFLLGPMLLWIATDPSAQSELSFLFPADVLPSMEADISMGSCVLSAIFFAAGLALPFLVLRCLRDLRGDPRAWLLVPWIGGTLIFVTLLNWTVAARSILPLVPPLAILVARLWSTPSKGQARVTVSRAVLVAAAGLGMTVAFAATWSDAHWANSVRDQARRIVATYSASAPTVRFVGHWGFQYYMQNAGAEPVNQKGQLMNRGDVIVLSRNNYRVPLHKLRALPRLDSVTDNEDMPLCLVDVSGGACFYSHHLGLLPMGVPKRAPDVYVVVQIAQAGAGTLDRR